MEIANPKSLDENQIKVIRDHIALVLTKVTPNVYIPKLSSPTLDPNYFPGQTFPAPTNPLQNLPFYTTPPNYCTPIVTCSTDIKAGTGISATNVTSETYSSGVHSNNVGSTLECKSNAAQNMPITDDLLKKMSKMNRQATGNLC